MVVLVSDDEALTSTVALSAEVPPGPVQVTAKVVSWVRAPEALFPLVATLPVHPPYEAHDVALVEDQVTHTP